MSTSEAAADARSDKNEQNNNNNNEEKGAKATKAVLKTVPRFIELTDEHEKKIDDFIAGIVKAYDPLPPQFLHMKTLLPPEDQEQPPTRKNAVRCYAYGFLVARQWDVTKALEMAKGSIEYRQTHHLDEINIFPAAMSLRGYDQEDLQKKLNLHPPRQPARLDKITAGVDNTFSTGVHYWDRQGQPVLYLMIGRCDPTGLLDALKANASVGQTVKDVMWEFVIQVTRACEGIAEYQNKRIAEGTLNVENSDEGLIRSISVVVDLEGLSMKHLKKAILDLFQSCMVTLFSNYPDVVFRIVGVNCQGIVKFAYNLVKGSLDPGVRQKVSFHSSGKETTAALADLIEPKYIPTHYGGECTCEANCIASFDPANPKKHTEGTDSMDFEEKVKTEHVSLAAGEKFNKQFNVINGEDVLYDFAIESKKTADFSIYMIPTEAAAKVNLKKPSSKELKHYRVKHVTSARESDRYTATDVGVVLLLWENNGWFKEHKLQVCAFKEEKVVTREADAASNKTKEKEETKKGDNFSDS